MERLNWSLNCINWIFSVGLCRYAYNPLCVIPNLRIFGKSTGIFLCVCLCVCVCVCAPVCTCVCWGHACVCVLISQSCLTLCNPLDCSLPGSSVHGILQARILEWVAISFSRGSSQPRNRSWVSRNTGRFFTIWATRHLRLQQNVTQADVSSV